MVKISPSIISADSGSFLEETKALEAAGAEYLHIDVMDGNFVPNITIGSMVVKALRKHTNLVFDVHLMTAHPSRHIEDFAAAGADIITIHLESEPHVCRTLQLIRSLGKRSGVAILPTTPTECLKYLLDHLDLILVMLVDPGFSGQQSMESLFPKVAETKKIIGSRAIEISVDGGINPNNSPKLIQLGADVLVTGNALFKGKDYSENMRKIRLGQQ